MPGSSLTDLLISLALGTTVVSTMGLLLGGTLDEQNRLSLRDDFRAVRNEINMAVSCKDSTVTVASCAAGSFLLRDRAGNVVLAAAPPFRVVNNLQIRPRCVPCPGCANGRSLIVEAIRRDAAGNPARLPGTRQPMDWTNLYGDFPFKCPVKS